eukprot:gene3554-6289_t
MSKFVVIKYYEENATNAKIITTPSEYFSNSEINLKNISKLINDDDKWLAKFNPTKKIEYYDQMKDKFLPLIDSTVLQLPEDSVLKFYIQRESVYENLLQEIPMSFTDDSQFNKHLDEQFSLISDNEEESNSSIRYYDIGYHGYIRLRKKDEFPFKRAKNPNHPTIKILLERHHEYRKGDDDFIFIDEFYEAKDEDFVLISPIINLDEIISESTEYYKEITNNVINEELPITEHIRTKPEEMRKIAWMRIDVPKKLLSNEKTVLKQLLMLGIHGEFRREIYFIMSGMDEKTSKENYEKEIKKVFSTYYKQNDLKIENIKPTIYATFGGKLSKKNYLNESGKNALKRVLCVLGFKYPQIEYAPFVINFISHLLCFVQEEDCFTILNSLFLKSVKNEKFFKKNLKSHLLFLQATKDSIHQQLPKIWNVFQHLKFHVTVFTQELIDHFFFEHLPFDIITHLMDVFIKQGMKSFIKLMIAVLKKLEVEILKCNSLDDLKLLFEQEMMKFNAFDESEIFNSVINTALTKNKLKSFDAQNSEKIENYLTKIKRLNFVYTRPKIEHVSNIIENENQLEILWSWLPNKQKMQTIYKVFSTKTDGYNLTTIYKTIQELESPLILLISATSIKGEINKELLKENQKNDKNETKIFGAFANEPFEILSSYQGSADTFLFTLKPEQKCYKWTKKNDYYMIGKEDCLMFGGGIDGKTGLYIDDELLMGNSEKCQTFDNEPLCDTNSFMIYSVEIYAFK